MALHPVTDQFSQFLRLAFLRSPNYVTGVSGWTVNQDGSAEFNNLTIRGTFFGSRFIINSAGAFFYSGAPASGNLIASITDAAGTDSFGNAYVGGITSYVTGGTGIEAQLAASALSWINRTNPGNTPPQISGAGNATGEQLNLTSGTGTGAASAAVLTLLDSLASGIGVAQATANFQMSIVAALASRSVLSVQNITAAPTSPIEQIIAQAAGDFSLGIQVNGDTNQRFRADSTGALNWGPGNAAVDITMSRTAANILSLGNNTFIAALLEAITAAAGNAALIAEVTGDTNPRFQVLGSGATKWGPGNAVTDTTLYRAAAALLAADPVAFNNAGAAETFQAFSFANSWAQAAGRAASNYRRIIVPGEMELIGSVVVPVGFAVGQAITNAAAAAYQPAHIQSLIGLDTTTNLMVRLAWTGGGVLQFIGPLANTAAGNTLDIPVQRIHLTD